MNDVVHTRLVTDSSLIPTAGTAAPLVFISHDTRDADLAEAFSKLLKSVSAGMIKTFRSSDKRAGEGIEFGDEWYRRLMEQLQSTSDVVCLFTERSLDRPWLLFEAGVAKGKLNTPVIGIALGVALDRVTTGPFYQFQNMDDSEVDLARLVQQLAKRVPGLELDIDVVNSQVRAFKTATAEILKSLASSGKKKSEPADAEESPFAKVIEEMKTLPARVAERLNESGDPVRRRRIHRFHPMMLDELLHGFGEPGDPLAILIAASLLRDDLPWLYELAMEVYRAAKSAEPVTIENELIRLRCVSEMVRRSHFLERFGADGKESYIIAMEFPRVLERTLEHTLHNTLNGSSPIQRKRTTAKISRDAGPSLPS